MNISSHFKQAKLKKDTRNIFKAVYLTERKCFLLLNNAKLSIICRLILKPMHETDSIIIEAIYNQIVFFQFLINILSLHFPKRQKVQQSYINIVTCQFHASQIKFDFVNRLKSSKFGFVDCLRKYNLKYRKTEIFFTFKF